MFWLLFVCVWEVLVLCGSFWFCAGKAAVCVGRVILKLVAPAWNFSQPLSFIMSKEEE